MKTEIDGGNELGNFTSSTMQSLTVSIFTVVFRTSTLQFIPWHYKIFRIQGISNVRVYEIAFLYD